MRKKGGETGTKARQTRDIHANTLQSLKNQSNPSIQRQREGGAGYAFCITKIMCAPSAR